MGDIIGASVGAGLGVIGSIFGGISASKAAKKRKKAVENEMADNEAWYNRRYNEDATQRADAQRILNRTEDIIRNRNKAAAGTQAVMGGTDATAAATREANANALADATASIAEQGAAQKDNIEQQYRENRTRLKGQLNDIEAQRSQAIGQAIGGVIGAAGGIASAALGKVGSGGGGGNSGSTKSSSSGGAETPKTDTKNNF